MPCPMRNFAPSRPQERRGGRPFHRHHSRRREVQIRAQTWLCFEPDPQYTTGISRNVRRGKQFSDFCVVTNHGHEPGNWSQEPPDYEQAFARMLIDAGADAYIVHGPHQLRGVEIYKRRPIFYSIGNFTMDDLRTPVGADMFSVHRKDARSNTDAEVTAAEMAAGFADPVFYESVVTVSRFEKNKLSELRLYRTCFARRFPNRGVPRLATAPHANAILERLQKLVRDQNRNRGKHWNH